LDGPANHRRVVIDCGLCRPFAEHRHQQVSLFVKHELVGHKSGELPPEQLEIVDIHPLRPAVLRPPVREAVVVALRIAYINLDAIPLVKRG
jgi:hypothetical protein